MGLLRVKGAIDTGQFWPKGTSDADTAVILVGVDAFQFQATPGGAFRTTHAFEGTTGSEPPTNRRTANDTGRTDCELRDLR